MMDQMKQGDRLGAKKPASLERNRCNCFSFPPSCTSISPKTSPKLRHVCFHSNVAHCLSQILPNSRFCPPYRPPPTPGRRLHAIHPTSTAVQQQRNCGSMLIISTVPEAIGLMLVGILLLGT